MRYTNQSARLNDDACALKNKNVVNDSVIDNRMFNFYFNNSCDCPVLDDIAFDNNFIIKDGFGIGPGCTIDNDSEIRMNSKVTHDRGRIQLCSRTYQGVPNLNRGGLVPNVESRLRDGDDTSDIRNVDKVMEKGFDVYMPLIPCLSKQVQDPQHIIPQWTWGGSATRQDMVSNDYLQKCNYEYKNNNWVKKA